ncbi:MAG: hypothetical protein ACRDF4_04130 [Rhabdochlamydiaceae bacterium]
MDKQLAIQMIDAHKNTLIDPVELLNWVWLRVIILSITPQAWEQAVGIATEVLSV